MAGYDGPIDMNRGVMYCTHPSAVTFRIFMYLDTPGEYLDGHGRPVPERLASEAGFPVERFRKQRLINSEKKKFEETLRNTLNMQETREVHREEAGLTLIHYPETGVAYIEREGERLYDTPIPLATAAILFEEFVKDAKARAEEVKAEPDIGKASEASPSPPPNSLPAEAQAPKKGAAAMLK